MQEKTLGRMIADLRKEKGMTQLELANKMGVSDKAVSKWERNLSCPDINTIPNLAKLFNVSVEDLLSIKSPKQPSKVHELISVILKGIAMAMGISVVVLSVLGELDVNAAITMLGLGLTCLAIQML